MPGGTTSARRRISSCERGPGIGVRSRMVGISVVPADGLLVEVDVDLLGLEILLNAPWPKLAAEAGLLIAAPRRLHVGGLHVVHPDDARAQGFDSPHGFEDIARPNRCSQAVRRVI